MSQGSAKSSGPRRKRRSAKTAGTTARTSSEVVGFLDQVFCSDNASLMKSLPDGCCDMIYVDPPFFSGKERRRPASGHAFADQWPGGLAEYADFLLPRLGEMQRLLRETGTILVHLDWHAVHYVKVAMDEIFGYTNFLNEIIWSYRTGGVSKRWFGRKHDTILSYARKRGQQKFHVLRDGAFRTDGLNYDEKGRPYKSTRNGRLYFHEAGPALTDVWELPFLSTVSLERTGYPTQKPLVLLRRLIESCTDAGDVVADFFCGSGTTLVAAAALGRRYLGCDAEPNAVDITRQRLSECSTLWAAQTDAC